MLEVYCDGGSRGNPGPAAYGFVVKKNRETIKEEGGYLGFETNNFAEYTALVKALSYLEGKNKGEEIQAYLDSQLVVSQLSGLYKVKSPKIRELVFKVRQLETSFRKVSYLHICRDKNKEADKMVNIALDKQLNGN